MSYEKETREKNESILRLNALINERYESNSQEYATLKEKLKKKETETFQLRKEINELNGIITLKDKELFLKKEEVNKK